MSTTPARAPSTASALDTARVLARVIAPTLAVGVIVRRRRAMALADRLDVDASATDLLRALRAHYGSGPLRLRLPGRSMAVVLDPEDVEGILRRSASEFTSANWEKQEALGHFQPRGVLISRGRPRAERRRFHEAVLQTREPVHELAPRIVRVVDEEVEQLVSGERLDWDAFATAWWRIVRRVVLGDGARDDRELIESLNQLRADANWAFLAPRHREHQRRFQERLRHHLRRAESGSLAEHTAQRGPGDVDAAEQVPHWLFAFDAAGMVVFRALALLATHPEQAKRAREEIAAAEAGKPALLPYLRGCVHESVRLWPTTPALLRDSLSQVDAELPAGTGFFIYEPLFHRDPDSVPHPHEFAPQDWVDGTSESTPALVPFSAGPGRCPGEDLVLLVTSSLLGSVLRRRTARLSDPHGLDPARPLPATLNNFELTFRTGPATAEVQDG